MILALGNDTALDVYESPGALAGAVEGLDIEAAVVGICDERGQRCGVEWVTPNRHGRVLWLLPWSSSGMYRLRPVGPPDPAAARALVGRAETLGRRGPFASLADVRASIAEPGAAADTRPSSR